MEVERSRLEARRELQELRRQIKMIDAESEKKSQEVMELQKRIAVDETKQQELEETLSATEREFSNAISDHKDIQNKLKDEVRSLAQGLQSREQECADLKIRLSDS